MSTQGAKIIYYGTTPTIATTETKTQLVNSAGNANTSTSTTSSSTSEKSNVRLNGSTSTSTKSSTTNGNINSNSNSNHGNGLIAKETNNNVTFYNNNGNLNGSIKIFENSLKGIGKQKQNDGGGGDHLQQNNIVVAGTKNNSQSSSNLCYNKIINGERNSIDSNSTNNNNTFTKISKVNNSHSHNKTVNNFCSTMETEAAGNVFSMTMTKNDDGAQINNGINNNNNDNGKSSSKSLIKDKDNNNTSTTTTTIITKLESSSSSSSLLTQFAHPINDAPAKCNLVDSIRTLFVDVIVTNAVSPLNFSIQSYKDYGKLKLLENHMTNWYSNHETSSNHLPLQFNNLILNGFYAVRYLVPPSISPPKSKAQEEIQWRRCQIIKPFNQSLPILTYLVDHGCYFMTEPKNIQPLLKMYCELPCQTLEAKLHFVDTRKVQFTPEDCHRFHKQVEGKPFCSIIMKPLISSSSSQATAYLDSKENSKINVVLIDTSGEKDQYIHHDYTVPKKS